MAKFSKKTFTYFDEAYEHRFDPNWFEANKALYEDHVLAPMSYMLNLMHLKF